MAKLVVTTLLGIASRDIDICKNYIAFRFEIVGKTFKIIVMDIKIFFLNCTKLEKYKEHSNLKFIILYKKGC